ncbi:hypothetical protein H8356DRAFT_1343682 [Neocallimastix lanati (nom. inval.)]|nr:hypothetical protein H8356DRAFT_1343682 [Neocallimastix sp. JGI-2020a]
MKSSCTDNWEKRKIIMINQEIKIKEHRKVGMVEKETLKHITLIMKNNTIQIQVQIHNPTSVNKEKAEILKEENDDKTTTKRINFSKNIKILSNIEEITNDYKPKWTIRWNIQKNMYKRIYKNNNFSIGENKINLEDNIIDEYMLDNNESILNNNSENEKVNKGKINEDKINEDKINEDKINEDKINEDKINEDKINEDKINEDKINEDKFNEDKIN